jgi:hypothetical protein
MRKLTIYAECKRKTYELQQLGEGFLCVLQSDGPCWVKKKCCEWNIEAGERFSFVYVGGARGQWKYDNETLRIFCKQRKNLALGFLGN